MGIRNIHILTESKIDNLAIRAQEVLQEKLMAEHRNGTHSFGSMRRDCPLCQANR